MKITQNKLEQIIKEETQAVGNRMWITLEFVRTP